MAGTGPVTGRSLWDRAVDWWNTPAGSPPPAGTPGYTPGRPPTVPTGGGRRRAAAGGGGNAGPGVSVADARKAYDDAIKHDKEKGDLQKKIDAETNPTKKAKLEKDLEKLNAKQPKSVEEMVKDLEAKKLPVPEELKRAQGESGKPGAEVDQLKSATKKQDIENKVLEDPKVGLAAKNASEIDAQTAQAEAARAGVTQKWVDTGANVLGKGMEVAGTFMKDGRDKEKINADLKKMEDDKQMKREEFAFQGHQEKLKRRDSEWQQEKANIVKAREVQKNKENAAGNALAKAGATSGIGQNGEMLEKQKGPVDAQGKETDRRTADRKQQADRARAEREQTIAQFSQIRGDASSRQV